MINYIDKLRIAATVMVFSLHSLLFTGKNFPMQDILGEAGGYFIFFHSCVGRSLDIFCNEWISGWDRFL